MPTLALLACRMFEDEIVHLLEEDSDYRLIVVDNDNTGGFERKVAEQGIDYELVPFDQIEASIGQSEQFTIMVNLLEFALDAKPERLRDKVYQTVEEMVELCDGILVLYGLCGNVLGSIESDFEHMDIPVRILKDSLGNIVDDCICASFGSRDEYLNALEGEERGVGTYFLTPMQAINWKEMVVLAGLTPDPDNIEMTKMVFDYSGYKNVGKVNTGLNYEKEFDKTVDEFASLFDFNTRHFEGSTRVVDNSYRAIKEEILKKK
ncbi:hypothetical protein J2755_000466 [Methanohalophilus levihalophilus]|uniref:DUF1638 domain-containing protein n=1 Tax=Methanohalophilus levihalophilus TaxID=1431282 RepID=UPI001AE2F7EA|nr:DUF1638 domain-containing protein [Methanohalophilus levihalophilus]MBP2029546.1 hypothetical protein [Methanohalophilus levihalophilus]